MDKETKQSLNNLAERIDKGFKAQEFKFDKKLENLATMVARGFEQVDKRFEQVDKRFGVMDKHFDKIEGQVMDLTEEVRQMRLEIKQIWAKLEEIEKRLDKVIKMSQQDTDALAGDVVDLKKRVEFLENRVKELQYGKV